MALAGLHARTKTGEFRGPETKSGVPIYAGGASQFEEWKFRTMLRYKGCKDEDKPKIIDLCRKLIQLDFNIIATRGTHDFLTKNSINSKVVKKVKEGHPNIVDLIKDNEIDIVMNTTLTKMEVTESFSIRRTALTRQVPYFTTVAGAFAAVEAIEYLKNDSIRVKPLQEYF